MSNEMFCFQCEQTASCTACTGHAGVCGKTAEVADDQDKLTGALIGLARTCAKGAQATDETYGLVIDGLFTTVTNVNFNDETVNALIDRIHAESAALASAAGIDAAADYDVANIWNDDEDIRSLKSLILFGLRGTSAYASHARVLGKTDAVADAFFLEALAALGEEGSMDSLLPLVIKTGEVNLAVMGLLDAANTGAFGTPEPTEVTLDVEAGPFIVITGHDLGDIKALLEQTEGRGVGYDKNRDAVRTRKRERARKERTMGDRRHEVGHRCVQRIVCGTNVE